MKRFMLFCLTATVVVGLTAWLGALAFHSRIGEEGVQAIVMSAGIAVVVQCLTFGVALGLMPGSAMLGWAAGIAIRVFTLIVHGFLGVRLLGLRADAALLSLAAFFFLTTIIEPFFLPQPATAVPSTKPPAPPS